MNEPRTNIKLLPNKKTIDKINNILCDIPHNDFLSDSHCTIIFSPDIIEPENIKTPKIKLPIIGTKAHFSFFDTRDDGIVLVIEFASTTANELFKYLKNTYKFTTKYDEYRPHITIQKNIKNYENIKLPEIDFNLEFDNLIIEITK